MNTAMFTRLQDSGPAPHWFRFTQNAREAGWGKIVLALLLALPLIAAAASGTQDASGKRGAARNQPPEGFGLVSAQWCDFYPQLPFCPNSGTAVTAAPSAAPPGMGFVPKNWCNLVPTLPICGPTSPGGALPGEVTGFGSNPGKLRMIKHVPQGLGDSVPLVVALHGCTQEASSYDDETGWVKYADMHKFALLLPQATVNPLKCFRWFESGHNERDKGEALSIKQMIDRMKADHPNIDPKRIYVTGLSAGGAMTAVMLATYPDIFAGGAIIAGIAYKCADSSNGVNEAKACGVGKDFVANKVQPLSPEKKAITPAQWAAKVRNASSFTGPFPRVSIWHGDKDGTVNMDNMTELMEQWTGVHQISQTPSMTETLKGGALHPVTHQVFNDAGGNAVVETYLVNGMDHATPVDPGSGNEQCGKAAPFIANVGICSSFFIGKFWGLIK